MGKLLISKSGFELQEIELAHGTITVGRAKDNNVQLNDATVSSHHAKIVTVMSTSYIQDLGSTNGIFINGQPVIVQALHPDDIISIGNHEILFKQNKASQSSQDENVYDTQVMNSMAGVSSSKGPQKTAVPDKAFTNFRDTINFTELSQVNPGLRVVVDNTSGSVNQHSLDIDVNVEKFEENKSGTISSPQEELVEQNAVSEQLHETIPPYVEVPAATEHETSAYGSGINSDEVYFKAAQEKPQQFRQESAEPAGVAIDDDHVIPPVDDVSETSPNMRSKQPFMSSEEVVEQLIMMGRDKTKKKKKSSGLSAVLGILTFVAIAVAIFFQLQ